jgi:hypothetical protein
MFGTDPRYSPGLRQARQLVFWALLPKDHCAKHLNAVIVDKANCFANNYKRKQAVNC